MEVDETIEILALHSAEAEESWEREVRKTCFAASHACRGKLGEFHPFEYGKSFSWAEMGNMPNVATVVVSRYFPLVALSETTLANPDFKWISNSRFAKAIEAGGSVRFFGAETLNFELSREDRQKFGQLGGSWSYNMKYWKPETLGHVLFNWWD